MPIGQMVTCVSCELRTVNCGDDVMVRTGWTKTDAGWTCQNCIENSASDPNEEEKEETEDTSGDTETSDEESEESESVEETEAVTVS